MWEQNNKTINKQIKLNLELSFLILNDSVYTKLNKKRSKATENKVYLQGNQIGQD